MVTRSILHALNPLLKYTRANFQGGKLRESLLSCSDTQRPPGQEPVLQDPWLTLKLAAASVWTLLVLIGHFPSLIPSLGLDFQINSFLTKLLPDGCTSMYISRLS